MTKQAVVDEPLQTLDNGTNQDEKQNIWASILRDVKSSTKKAPATKSLVVLGDNESGRTTLVAKLQGNEDPKRGAGLEYHYIDVKDDDRDDTPKLGVWILDGDAACSAPLLKFAIKPDSLDDIILILVASMTQPWSLLSTLQKWTALVEEHIDRLKLDPTRLREMRDQLQYEFQHYIEPNDSSIMSNSSTTIKSNLGNGRVPNSVSSNSLAVTTPLSPTNGEGQVILPLPDGVLTKSLGIQIIVVITKCDVMPALEKENDYKDEQFDFMQYHLRKFCLEYGAALFYTSVKEKKNIDKLYKYIVHKCYGYPFPYTATIVDRDSIFVPVGWDNPKKAEILLENLHRLKSTDNYSDVFTKTVARRPLQRDNDLITAEDDQEFLAKLQTTLNRASSPTKDDGVTPAVSRRPIDGSTSQTPGRQSKPSSTTPGDPTRAPNDGALANFFNSLLTKKSAGSVTPTSAGSPIAQRPVTQSPTTPSSKRLQQHPLTFAVTPPPARSRTPTSHKPFLSPINNDTSPKALSPVIEQQPKVDQAEVEANDIANHTTTTDVESDLKSRSESFVDESLTNNHLTTSEQGSEIRAQNLRSPSPPIENNTDKQEDQTPALLSTESSSNLQENEEQQNGPKESLNSSRRTSEVNSLTTSQPLTPTTNENNTLPVENTEELNENGNNKNENSNDFPDLNSQWKQLDQQRSLSRNQSTEDQTSLASSAADLPITENESPPKSPISQQFSPSSPKNEQSHIPTELLSLETAAAQSSVDEERSQSPSLSNQVDESNQQKNRSSSPILKQEQSETQSESPVQNENREQHESPTTSTDDKQQKDQPISPTVEQKPDNYDNVLTVQQEENQSSLPDNNQEHVLERSRSSSPVETKEQRQTPQKSRSPSPVQNTEYEQSESSLPTNNQEQVSERTRSPSPIRSERQEESQSPTLTNNQEGILTRSRSPSPIQTEEKKQYPQRSRSPSPVQNETETQVPERSKSPSPRTDDGEKRSRSPSPIQHETEKEVPQRSRSSSPLNTSNEAPQRSRSPSPLSNQQQVPQRSRSPSPIRGEPETQVSQRSRSSSLIQGETKEQVAERSRSPSPIQNETKEQVAERSRSPSPLNTSNEAPQRSRSPSPLSNQQQVPQRSRSPSPIQNETETQVLERSRSPSPIQNETETQVPERSRSPSPLNTPNQASQRSRSQSPRSNQEQAPERSRSHSPIQSGTKEQVTERSRSPSPLNTSNEAPQRSRSPSPVQGETEKEIPQRSRSPSPIQNEDQQEGQAQIPIDDEEQTSQRSRSSSIVRNEELEENQSQITTNPQEQVVERSQSPSPKQSETEEQVAWRSRSPSPNQFERQEHDSERSRSPSSLNNQEHVDKRSRSPSPVRNEERKESQSQLLTNSQEQTSQRSRSPSPVRNEEQEQGQSPTRTNNPIDESGEPNSSIVEQQPLTAEKTERSPSPSLNRENPEQNVTFVPSPTAGFDINENDNRGSETQLPSAADTSSRSSVDLHEDTTQIVSENPIEIPLTSTSPINEGNSSNIDTKNTSNASPLVSPSKVSVNSNTNEDEIRHSNSSTQRSSLDRSHVLNSSLPSFDRRTSIPRSKSQSTVARPNTLPFTPNNHDLDGLYTSNVYDDEDELLEDSEYHRNSAPSTVSIERRRSSFLDNTIEQHRKSVDPNDVVKRLSLVENPTTDGKDNAEGDTSISKDT